MTITLTPRETARLIVDRANELQELVNQKCEPKHRDIWRAALRTQENRIWEATTKLANMATYKYDGRELSRDAAEAVGALEELVEAVKTLYGLNDDEDVEPADCVK